MVVDSLELGVLFACLDCLNHPNASPKEENSYGAHAAYHPLILFLAITAESVRLTN